MHWILRFDYKAIREAYREIKTFIENKTGGEIDNLKTTIENDLGCTGDDSYELISEFIKKYKLDPVGFEFSKHFLNEGELFQPVAWFVLLLFGIVEITVWLLTFGKYNLQLPDSDFLKDRQTLDLTFGDMMAWYLHGKFVQRQEVRIEMK